MADDYRTGNGKKKKRRRIESHSDNSDETLCSPVSTSSTAFSTRISPVAIRHTVDPEELREFRRSLLRMALHGFKSVRKRSYRTPVEDRRNRTVGAKPQVQKGTEDLFSLDETDAESLFRHLAWYSKNSGWFKRDLHDAEEKYLQRLVHTYICKDREKVTPERSVLHDDLVRFFFNESRVVGCGRPFKVTTVVDPAYVFWDLCSVTLPKDVLLEITKFLHYDRALLDSVSLVHSSWRVLFLTSWRSLLVRTKTILLVPLEVMNSVRTLVFNERSTQDRPSNAEYYYLFNNTRTDQWEELRFARWSTVGLRDFFGLLLEKFGGGPFYGLKKIVFEACCSHGGSRRCLDTVRLEKLAPNIEVIRGMRFPIWCDGEEGLNQLRFLEFAGSNVVLNAKMPKLRILKGVTMSKRQVVRLAHFLRTSESLRKLSMVRITSFQELGRCLGVCSLTGLRSLTLTGATLGRYDRRRPTRNVPVLHQVSLPNCRSLDLQRWDSICDMVQLASNAPRLTALRLITSRSGRISDAPGFSLLASRFQGMRRVIWIDSMGFGSWTKPALHRWARPQSRKGGYIWDRKSLYLHAAIREASSTAVAVGITLATARALLLPPVAKTIDVLVFLAVKKGSVSLDGVRELLKGAFPSLFVRQEERFGALGFFVFQGKEEKRRRFGWQ